MTGPVTVTLDREPIDRLVSTFADERHCPTLSWGITIDDRLTTGQIGGVSEHTVYRIASMTKSFSAAAVLLLRDDGVLRLDDPAVAHAPELSALDRIDSAPITIRDLLSMTSGLPTDDPWADRHLDLTDDEFDRIISDRPLFAFPTGDAFEYSNFGFAVLGRVIHRATGERIQDIVTRRLLEPLGMTRTTWTAPDHDDWARPTRWLDGAHVAELEPLPDGLIAPMGGLWTSVSDLNRWITWLDDAVPARAEPDLGPLSRASRREMQSPQRYSKMTTVRGVRSSSSYGFGLRMLDEPDLGTVVTHSGGLPGYGSNMRWLAGRRVGAIALANTTYAPMAELTALLLDQVAAQGLAPDEAIPVSASIADLAPRLVAVLNSWDDANADALFTASLIQDDGLDRRRAAAERLTAATGALTIDTIEAHSGARATVRCTGSLGRHASVTILLAPPRPPRIQSYTARLEPVDDTADTGG